MSETVDQIEERIEARKIEREKAENAQRALDLAVFEQLQEEHGAIARVRVRFVNGLPTLAIAKTPTGAQYKRYVDQINKAAEKKSLATLARAAQELLAQSCWIYPTDEAGRGAMLEQFPGLLSTIAIAAVGLAEGKVEDEGKG